MLTYANSHLQQTPCYALPSGLGMNSKLGDLNDKLCGREDDVGHDLHCDQCRCYNPVLNNTQSICCTCLVRCCNDVVQ